MSEFKSLSSESAFEQAEKTGKKVVLPEPNQLLIDIDDEAALKNYITLEGLLERHWGVEAAVKTPSPSGRAGRFHVTVTLDRTVTPLERIALQLAMGSDRKREILSLARLEHGDEHPTLFFEKKDV